jgi:hypothetical protein
MKNWLVKLDGLNFDMSAQPEGFVVGLAAENRFFICKCPTRPISPVTVELTDEQVKDFTLYQYPEGKKFVWDPFDGDVEYYGEKDNKGRRLYRFTEEQRAKSLNLAKFLVCDVWMADRVRLGQIQESDVERIRAEVLAIQTNEEMHTYIRKKAYYNL